MKEKFKGGKLNLRHSNRSFPASGSPTASVHHRSMMKERFKGGKLSLRHSNKSSPASGSPIASMYDNAPTPRRLSNFTRVNYARPQAMAHLPPAGLLHIAGDAIDEQDLEGSGEAKVKIALLIRAMQDHDLQIIPLGNAFTCFKEICRCILLIVLVNQSGFSYEEAYCLQTAAEFLNDQEKTEEPSLWPGLWEEEMDVAALAKQILATGDQRWKWQSQVGEAFKSTAALTEAAIRFYIVHHERLSALRCYMPRELDCRGEKALDLLRLLQRHLGDSLTKRFHQEFEDILPPFEESQDESLDIL